VTQKLSRFFEGLFFLFAVSFFLTAGSDFEDHFKIRIIFGSILIVFFLLFAWKRLFAVAFQHPVFWVFLCFVSFILLRAVWAFCLLHQANVDAGEIPFLQLYLASPGIWLFYLAFFGISLSFFNSKSMVRRFFIIMAAAGTVLALNVIPPLLRYGEGKFGYQAEGGQITFFLPLLYSLEWIPRYLIASYAHVNWVGDMISFGFFPALALAFYTFEIIKDKRRRRNQDSWERKRSGLLSSLALQGLGVLVMASAITLLLARGTIISWVISLTLCFIGMVMKLPSRTRFKFLGWVFVGLLGFLFWAGNLQRAWRETQTVQTEFDAGKSTSLATNRDAAKRAVAIYRDYALWGVGTDGFSRVAEKYGTADGANVFSLARFQAMCHYLQTLAEEGVGAYIYFLFLGVYFFEMLRGLARTKSRFKFIAGLTLLGSVVMILIHASVHHLMQRFPVAMLTYIVMGAGLAVTRRDFETE